MKSKRLFLAAGLACSLLFYACTPSPEGSLQKAEQAINADSIRSYIAALSDDSMEGRKPFSPGEQKTVRYISEQFRRLGLAPGNGDSYVQDVPMVAVNSVSSQKMHIEGANQSLDLIHGTDFTALSEHEEDSVQLVHSPLVFAGFGVVAPEYGWNDYAGLDVKGKTVVVLVNDPGFQSGDPTFFKGDTMTYYGRWTYKFEEAARQGAAGVLIVHQTAPASYPWSVVQSSFSGSQLYLKDADKHLGRCKMEGWLSYEAAKKLLAAGGITGDFMAMARKRGFKAIPLDLNLSVKFTNDIQYNVSHNVVGLLKGKRSPAEYIIYSAHWDHLGIGLPVNGDSIYNGAVDNASGVAALISMAKAFRSLPEKPERSILFIAVTAEEQGLLGSQYYAEHPIYPLNKTVADLNMDALGNYGRTKDFVITGLGQNDLEDYVKVAVSKQGGTIRGDLNPASGSYFRSDHFSFAKVGVPALDLHNGLESLDQDSAATLLQRKEYGEKHYHQPSDAYSPDMNTSGMAQTTRLLFEVGYKMSNESGFPGWKAGSEFKAVRDSMMNRE